MSDGAQQEFDAQTPSGDRMVTRIVVVVGVLMIGGAAAAVALLPGSSAENQSLLTHTISRGKLTVSVTEQGTLESSNNT